MFFIRKNIYFTKIARKGIHFLFNGKNVKQFCEVFMQKHGFARLNKVDFEPNTAFFRCQTIAPATIKELAF
jgi:hypothetical protein